MKKNVLVTILTCVALALTAVIVIPFKVESVGNGEGFVKTAVIPLVVIALSLVMLLLRKRDEEVSKPGAVGAAMAMMAVIAAEFLYMVTLPMRNHALGNDIAFNEGAWKSIVIAFMVAFLVTLCLTIVMPLFKLHKSKYALPLPVIGIFAGLLVVSVFNCILSNEYAGGDFSDGGKGAMIFAIISAVVLVAGLICEFLFANKAKEACEPCSDAENFQALKDEYLDELYKNSKDEMVARGRLAEEEEPAEEEEEEEAPAEEVVEEEPAEEEAPAEEEQPAEEEAPAEEVVAPVEEPAEEEKPEKEKKVIEPSVAALAEYAMTFDDVRVVYTNENQDSYKVFRGKKLMCIVQTTKNDYRITFQRKPISVANLIIKYPNLITKAPKPEGEQWFKAINKGGIEEEDLKIMIRFSHKFLVDAEAKELAKKEKAKQKAKEKREKERAKAKEKRDKERAKAKEQARREKEKAEALAAKQAKEAEKAEKQAQQEAPAEEAK